MEGQRRYHAHLTEEDARAITTKVASFIDTLKDWQFEALKPDQGG